MNLNRVLLVSISTVLGITLICLGGHNLSGDPNDLGVRLAGFVILTLNAVIVRDALRHD